MPAVFFRLRPGLPCLRCCGLDATNVFLWRLDSVFESGLRELIHGKDDDILRSFLSDRMMLVVLVRQFASQERVARRTTLLDLLASQNC